MEKTKRRKLSQEITRKHHEIEGHKTSILKKTHLNAQHDEWKPLHQYTSLRHFRNLGPKKTASEKLPEEKVSDLIQRAKNKKGHWKKKKKKKGHWTSHQQCCLQNPEEKGTH